MATTNDTNSMRAVEFAKDEFYHVFNRGVEHLSLFKTQRDFQRFYNSLYLFNNVYYANPGNISPPSTLRTQDIEAMLVWEKRRLPFVSIASFCLIRNHFHLFLLQRRDEGIPQFMHRLGMGYAHYFNTRYHRTGRLFEGPFKAVLVEREAHYEHLPRYIHLNALDGTNMPWRDGRITRWAEAKKLLERYPWSSHHVYAGKRQLLPVVDESLAGEFFDSPERYEEYLRSWSGRFTLPPTADL